MASSRLLLVLLIGLLFGCAERPDPLYVSASADNDLVRVLRDSGQSLHRFDSPAEAITAAPPEAGVLLLADDYPRSVTHLQDDVLGMAADKRLGLYVEYATGVPGVRADTARFARSEPHTSRRSRPDRMDVCRSTVFPESRNTARRCATAGGLAGRRVVPSVAYAGRCTLGAPCG